MQAGGGLVLDVEFRFLCSLKYRVKSSADCEDSCVGPALRREGSGMEHAPRDAKRNSGGRLR